MHTEVLWAVPLVPEAVYEIFLYGWMLLAGIVFLILLKVTAPFGRHTSTDWGPQISSRPAWMIMECVPLLVFGSFTIPLFPEAVLPMQIMMLLYLLHYLHRGLIFPWRLKERGKKMPVAIFASAILFNLVNATSLGYFFPRYANYEPSWLWDPRFLTGGLLFCFGAALNLWADGYLIRLRRNRGNGYLLPRGSWFEWISCPNHLGEILEWCGYALLCWNLPAFAFFIWTTANLLPRSLAHHRWYRQNFPEYPIRRKAVIPFLL